VRGTLNRCKATRQLMAHGCTQCLQPNPISHPQLLLFVESIPNLAPAISLQPSFLEFLKSSTDFEMHFRSSSSTGSHDQLPSFTDSDCCNASANLLISRWSCLPVQQRNHLNAVWQTRSRGHVNSRRKIDSVFLLFLCGEVASLAPLRHTQQRLITTPKQL